MQQYSRGSNRNLHPKGDRPVTYKLASIVLPVYNQADHIGDVVRGYERALAELPIKHELVLVPNGCLDNSVERCRELAREYPSVRVVASERGGWGLAVKLGLKEARGDLLCYTNSARTTPEDLMLLLRHAITRHGAVSKATRKIRESWRRRIGSLLFNLECRLLFGISLRDVNGTPKVFPRSFTKLLSLTRDDDLIDAEFNVICRREGYPVVEVPVYSSKRHGGKSTTSYKSAARMYRGAFELWKALRYGGERA